MVRFKAGDNSEHADVMTNDQALDVFTTYELRFVFGQYTPEGTQIEAAERLVRISHKLYVLQPDLVCGT